MSDELAQDEEDAEDYDLESLENRTRVRDDDEATLVGGRRPGSSQRINEDAVVFEIGDEDEDDDPATPKKRRSEHQEGREDERRGLMGRDD
jgi:hypothetical protein